MQLKFPKSKKSFKKHGLAFAPDLFWEIIIYTVFILAIASFIFGYYFFRQTNKEPDSEEVLGKQELIKQERLEKALQYFSDRQAKSFDILNSPAKVVDPSI